MEFKAAKGRALQGEILLEQVGEIAKKKGKIEKSKSVYWR